MASVMLRSCVVMRCFGISPCAEALKPICAAKPKFTEQTLTKSITSKAFRDPDVKKPKPWPYREKMYHFLHGFYDRTTHRFDENTKVIVVDGPIAAGKTCVAQHLAEEFDMYYVAEANMDLLYINSYGYDLRQLDPQLPESTRSFDVKDFCKNPNHTLAAQFQLKMYQLRYEQYIDALAHLLSTGQGVVLDRSVYSDFVFVEAMCKSGYMSRGARDVYYEVRKSTITEILRPHLFVYLDVPVDVVKQRVKDRAIPYEVGSKIFNDTYLSTMEEYYKQRHLKEMSEHSELLVYDWSSYGDVEVIIEDIERIDFDKYSKYDKKLADWRVGNGWADTEWEWADLRRLYANKKGDLLGYCMVPRFDVPELLCDGEDFRLYENVMENAPGNQYQVGYNKDMGDKGLFFKTKAPYRHTII